MDNERKNFIDSFKRRLYNFTLKLIEFIDKLNSKDFVTRRIADQLLRSGTSIIGNYVEGQSGGTRKEFTNYMNVSLKSSNESKLWLAILRDSKRAKREEIEWFLNELNEFSKILASSIIKLRKTKT
jgi:four helix bundle protein